MSREFNAMIFLQKYSSTNIFIFDQINKVEEINNTISFSIVTIIEAKTRESFQPYCICMIYEPINGPQGKLDVLTEITLNEWPQKIIGNKAEIIDSSELCNFQCRRTFKLDVKDEPSYGEGRYAILLVNATADEIDKDLSIAFTKQVSNVCFKVITQK